jgi:L-rhamnose mutarotase
MPVGPRNARRAAEIATVPFRTSQCVFFQGSDPMKAQMGGVAMLLATFVIGGLIGFGCSQSQNQSKAQVPKAETATMAAPGAEVSQAEPKSDAAATETASPPAAPTVKAKKLQRFGSIIGLKAEKKDYYNKLHANPWPEINAMIKKCNIQNYSIYEVELDGKLYLFSYFEYVGDDFKADMAKMAVDPKTKEWWAETDPCQIRLPGTPDGEQWLSIPRVYHLD